MPTSKARNPITVARFPEPSSEPPDRAWADAFLRALTSEFSKVIQPIGTQYRVFNYTVDRVLQGSGYTMRDGGPQRAVGRVGNVEVRINGSLTVRIGADPRASPPTEQIADTLCTLIGDLQTRGWLA